MPSAKLAPKPHVPVRRRLLRTLAWLTGIGVLLAIAGGWLALRWLPTDQFADLADRTPMELVRYTERRLEGHPRLQGMANPLFNVVRRLEQREAPADLLPLGKGQQAYSLAWPLYDAQGRPQPVPARARPASTHEPTRVLSSSAEIADAMSTARAGDVLEVAAGSYRIASSLTTRQAGEPNRPIVVRAARPGEVILESVATEAIVVSQPYWVFENLELRGACEADINCEHAFHVVSTGRSLVLLNNRFVDFNSPLKVNGLSGAWPDDGLLQFNTLAGTRARRADAPVSFVDLVGASGWRIVDNHVEHFVKDGDSRISYGICVKGGGRATRVERNLVVCTPTGTWQPGARVGISLGCGATGASYCREGGGQEGGLCAVEQFEGVVANNVVAHCNDTGIDLNGARGALVSQNTLVNTAGIDARGASQVDTYGNLLEGRNRAREMARLEAHGDLVKRRLDDLLAEPMSLDLRWRAPPQAMRPTPENGTDFCGRPRPYASPPGATVAARCDLEP